jgi:hypothetical protein
MIKLRKIVAVTWRMGAIGMPTGALCRNVGSGLEYRAAAREGRAAARAERAVLPRFGHYLSEAALAAGVVGERRLQPGFAEVGPHAVGEIQLRVGTFP